MLDWDTSAGLDPLPLALPQDSTGSLGDQRDWLPKPEDKAKFDEFGPMFGTEGEDGGTHDLPPVDVAPEADDPYDDWWEGGETSTGGNSSGGSGGSQDPTGLIDNFFAWVDSFLDRFGDSAMELAERDANSTFDRSRAEPLDRDGRQVGYIYDDGSFWSDRNGNGQPETHLRWVGNELWQDTNFDGSWDRRVR